MNGPPTAWGRGRRYPKLALSDFSTTGRQCIQLERTLKLVNCSPLQPDPAGELMGGTSLGKEGGHLETQPCPPQPPFFPGAATAPEAAKPGVKSVNRTVKVLRD